MNKVRYNNYVAFKIALSELLEEYDLAPSLKLHKYYFQDTNGDIFRSRCSMEVFQALNERFGDIISVEKSLALRSAWIVTYLEDPVIKVSESEPTSPYLEEEESEDIVEGLSDENDKPLFDLSYAKSLLDEEDQSISKNNLENYGKTFGIDLKKNRSFKNMLKDLQNHVKKS